MAEESEPAEVSTKPTRLPLGRSARRLSFERRVRLWLTGLAAGPVALTYALTAQLSDSRALAVLSAATVALAYLIAATIFFDLLIRPLQTLANVVAALREDDFSFRARGARRGDALGDLALEVNTLAGTLQQQRSSALDALTLVERVLGSMQSPVLAFDPAGRLRLSNAAARETFGMGRKEGGRSKAADVVGLHANDLGLGALLDLSDQGVFAPGQPGQARWSVRRAAFRLHGVPHTLLVLTDVGAALREEERSAWQRLIRVLGHEINNSLTPIKSIAGSLRTRLPAAAQEDQNATDPLEKDLRRGLAVIEDRAASLNRFLQAYQRLSRLPPPSLRMTDVPELVAKVAALETRVPVAVEHGTPLFMLVDPDQLQQALINLLGNAVDAALTPESRADGSAPAVVMASAVEGGNVTLRIDDNGPGITNPANLFVPFYTTKLTGSGIGLVLVQQIATAHGGAITLQSAPGVPGCSARLTLPVRRTM